MIVKLTRQRHKMRRATFILERTCLQSNNESLTPMNKAQLIDAVQEILGGDTSKRAAAEALDAVLQAIATGLKKEPVQLIGFGTFKPVERKARMGRNPKTKVPVEIKASKTVRFVPSAALKESV